MCDLLRGGLFPIRLVIRLAENRRGYTSDGSISISPHGKKQDATLKGWRYSGAARFVQT
jgi:hypothetical protein